jgi:Tfp pilus assembly protein PilF
VIRLFLILLLSGLSFAQDIFDPFDLGIDEETPIEDKTADELVLDALTLLQDERPLDARSRLIQAIKKDPKHIRAHSLLGHYYMAYVGHFRLAERYIEKAFSLFYEQNGKPPYFDSLTQSMHMNLYNLKSQSKLNLDQYQEALDVLDEFAGYGYMASWYPASRSWILMKLGNIQDAIRVARAGVMSGAEPGRTLNMLGILLSMNGQPTESISVFEAAIDLEESLGKLGNPATPLNNMGEVYEEMFDDKNAEISYSRALGKHDGCEHILPALNLAILMIDQLNLVGAKKAIDNFESCVAQYPLRNGEEHKALVHLARGRIDLYSGRIDEAIKHFEAALEKKQWFGKIGTSIEDLQVGVMQSLAQALRAKNNIVNTTRLSFFERRKETWESIKRLVRAYWLERQAKQILISQLRDFEDLKIRNTDSMLEYPTLGRLLSTIPDSFILPRLSKQKALDSRAHAQVFYDLYIAQVTKDKELAFSVLSRLRQKYDDLLRTEAMTLLASDSVDYQKLLFNRSPSIFRNNGFKLPVKLVPDERWTRNLIRRTPFIKAEDSTFSLVFKDSGEELEVNFISSKPTTQNARASGKDKDLVMNSLVQSIFSEEIK